jgi:hypothetical protein
MDRVERPAVHAIERNDVPSRIDDTTGDRDICGTRLLNSECNHLSRTFVGQALCRCHIHWKTHSRSGAKAHSIAG